MLQTTQPDLFYHLYKHLFQKAPNSRHEAVTRPLVFLLASPVLLALLGVAVVTLDCSLPVTPTSTYLATVFFQLFFLATFVVTCFVIFSTPIFISSTLHAIPRLLSRASDKLILRDRFNLRYADNGFEFQGPVLPTRAHNHLKAVASARKFQSEFCNPTSTITMMIVLSSAMLTPIFLLAAKSFVAISPAYKYAWPILAADLVGALCCFLELLITWKLNRLCTSILEDGQSRPMAS